VYQLGKTLRKALTADEVSGIRVAMIFSWWRPSFNLSTIHPLSRSMRYLIDFYKGTSSFLSRTIPELMLFCVFPARTEAIHESTITIRGSEG
jgi:hypothetical protein